MAKFVLMLYPRNPIPVITSPSANKRFRPKRSESGPIIGAPTVNIIAEAVRSCPAAATVVFKSLEISTRSVETSPSDITRENGTAIST
jgi:hypothetical protein